VFRLDRKLSIIGGAGAIPGEPRGGQDAAEVIRGAGIGSTPAATR
jgi:hypothetical protein